ncbi:MAG: nicotinate-nucleotide adenylyltransferase [Saprospiraceae bacterium]|nr:nicotinate-nucleotide adenylyltransferase [Saprospiraceae bacterium]
MNIGLFFGSFNPVHTGHLIIAQHIANQVEIDQVWLVVSPHNPLKLKSTLAADYDHLHLVNLALEDNPNIKSCSVEFKLPQPSYTIDTLTHLNEKYPQHRFHLIMGEDNLQSIKKWKNYELILANYQIYIYRRPDSEHTSEFFTHPNIRICKAPLLEISSTAIRDLIKEGKSIRYLVPDKVFEYLEGSTLYKK